MSNPTLLYKSNKEYSHSQIATINYAGMTIVPSLITLPYTNREYKHCIRYQGVLPSYASWQGDRGANKANTNVATIYINPIGRVATTADPYIAASTIQCILNYTVYSVRCVWCKF